MAFAYINVYFYEQKEFNHVYLILLIEVIIISINPHASNYKDIIPGKYAFISTATAIGLGQYIFKANITSTFLKDILTLFIQIESIACPVFFAVVIFIITNDKILERHQDQTLTRTSKKIMLMIRLSLLGYLISLLGCLVEFIFITGFVSIVKPYIGFQICLTATSAICIYPFCTTFAIAFIILNKVNNKSN